MTQKKIVKVANSIEVLSDSEGNLLSISALVLVGILLILVVLEWSGWQEGLPLIGLISLFGILFVRLPEDAPNRQMHLYISVQTGLIILMQLYGTVYIFLFFILSAQTMMQFSTKAGFRWIAVFILVTILGNMYNSPNLISSLLSSVVNGAGFLFFGVFGNALRRAHEAQQESQELLRELQEANAQLTVYAERVETLAVAEERNRLSREMHDTLGHRLTVSIVQLEGAGKLMARDPSRAEQMIATVRGQLKEGLDELRQTLTALRSPMLVNATLVDALTKLRNDFQQATGLTIHMDLPERLPNLDNAQSNTLYRAAQESLTNVQRHADARTIWLSLTHQQPDLILSVADDGQGVADHANGSGLGLRGMRERANKLGGSLSITPAPQGGVLLQMSLPLAQPEAAEQSQPASIRQETSSL